MNQIQQPKKPASPGPAGRKAPPDSAVKPVGTDPPIDSNSVAGEEDPGSADELMRKQPGREN